MKKILFFRKQLESERWIQAARRLWLIAQLVVSLLSINHSMMEQLRHPTVQTELQQQLDLYGGWKDVEESKTWIMGRDQN